MSNADKDADEAAEPFMEQAKDALGDATSGEAPDNPANPSLEDEVPQHQPRPSTNGQS
jgi:hypothetical protein